MSRPYFVSHANCTDSEPSPGWYVSVDDGGHPVLLGPFVERQDAQVAAEERQSETRAASTRAVQAILDANSHEFDFACAADREEAIGLVAREFAALNERLEDRENAVRDLNRLVADLNQQRNSLEAKLSGTLAALKATVPVVMAMENFIGKESVAHTCDVDLLATVDAAIARGESRGAVKPEPEMFEIGGGLFLCCAPGSRWHGWRFRRHPDGQYVSVRKSELGPPGEGANP